MSSPALAYSVKGLSPRVRGNPSERGVWEIRPGSIPARAGEPVKEVWDWTACQVYPRACGGTVDLGLAGD